MLTKDKVIEIFYVIDEFCMEFESEIKHHSLNSAPGSKKRNRACQLSDSEIMSILVYFHFGSYRNFKHYYLFYIKEYLDKEFPNAVSYNRFIELQARVAVPLMLFLNMVGLGKCTGITYVDSTPIRVCHQKRIHNHKVFKEVAERGKSTMGWFYGFKLHLVCNDKGELLNFALSKGNVDDRNENIINILCKDLFGKLYADKGYISKSLSELLFVDGVHIITGVKKNMKNQLMSLFDKIHLRKRSVIETINDQLKNIAQIEHSRHRSIHNFLMNLIAALTAYSFTEKKPAIKYDRNDDRNSQGKILPLFA